MSRTSKAPPSPRASELSLPTIQEEPMTFSVVVPEGFGPGSKLQQEMPNGQDLDLTVPEGVPPGSVLTLTLDPATGGWRCVAEPPAGAAPSPPEATLDSPLSVSV